MAAQLSSFMFEVNDLNIEKLLKNVELAEFRLESCKNIVLLFGKSTHQVICCHSLTNDYISTHIKVILTKEYDLCFVRAE